MKKLFTILFVVFIPFLILSCSNPGKIDDGNSFFEVTDVTGWDDWDNLTSGMIESWIVGEWDYKMRVKTNLETYPSVENFEGTCIVDFTGTSTNSDVVFSNSRSNPTNSNYTIYDHTDTLGEIKYRIDEYYRANFWDDIIDGFRSEGVTINNVSDKNVWKKVNRNRNKMEFYKSMRLTGTYEGETATLILQMNESLEKRQ